MPRVPLLHERQRRRFRRPQQQAARAGAPTAVPAAARAATRLEEGACVVEPQPGLGLARALLYLVGQRLRLPAERRGRREERQQRGAEVEENGADPFQCARRQVVAGEARLEEEEGRGGEC